MSCRIGAQEEEKVRIRNLASPRPQRAQDTQNLKVRRKDVLEYPQQNGIVEPMIIVTAGGLGKDADAGLDELNQGGLEVQALLGLEADGGVQSQGNHAVVATASEQLKRTRWILQITHAQTWWWRRGCWSSRWRSRWLYGKSFARCTNGRLRHSPGTKVCSM